ncbi:hypothetical protein [Vibrio phage V-YDF132]|nr:hypothetical protein [Vibrio phage V-YDF132]
MCEKCDLTKKVAEEQKEPLTAFRLLTTRFENPEAIMAMEIETRIGTQTVLVTPKAEGLAILALLPSTAIMDELAVNLNERIDPSNPTKFPIFHGDGSIAVLTAKDLGEHMSLMGLLLDMKLHTVSNVSSEQEEDMAGEAEKESGIPDNVHQFVHKAPEMEQ